jgi:chromosome segregation ATPase
VIQKQEDREESNSNAAVGRLVVSETLRSSAESSTSANKKVDSEDKDGEHMSLFWRVFGGTILSISSLVVITLYNNLSTGISDLRTDLNKERDAQAELVKKDDFNNRSTNIYDRLRTLDAMKIDLEGLRERVTANATDMQGVKKDTGAIVEELKKEVGGTAEGLKKDVAATADMMKKDEALMEIIKERLAAVESLKKDVAAIEVLKDKVATATADVKAIRDDVVKLQEGSEKTKSAELERKASQDLQYKQVEELLRVMQKDLQDCREKLARLEGAQPVTAPRPTMPPTTRP